ncbi:MAG: hypothetical protein OEM49_08460 [Myxococcales bacterium]|nr:hypothetical protein [Myxococcales bacterium]MDH5306073.1 hypothetical protein [Myxococcales bacterium]
MHRSEVQLIGPCGDCGAEIRLDAERAFTFGARGVLCWECAIRRGGRYDEARDSWIEVPRIDDLGNAYD